MAPEAIDRRHSLKKLKSSVCRKGLAIAGKHASTWKKSWHTTVCLKCGPEEDKILQRFYFWASRPPGKFKIIPFGNFETWLNTTDDSSVLNTLKQGFWAVLVLQFLFQSLWRPASRVKGGLSLLWYCAWSCKDSTHYVMTDRGGQKSSNCVTSFMGVPSLQS